MRADTLIIRADASVSIGTGHVMRCLALAQAWQEVGGGVVFVMAESTPAIEGRILSEGMDVVRLKRSATAQEARDLSAVAGERRAAWIVVDGYQFDSEYQRSLKNAGLKVLFVDDLGQCEHYFADIVLNQNAHATGEMYTNRDPGTRLLLGAGYAMLRSEFGPWREWRRSIASPARSVLVTMGGSDPDNFALRVIDAMRHVKVAGLEVVVVAGGSCPHFDVLEQSAKQSPVRVRLLRDVTNMPELMVRADVAVSAAGTTCAELCLLGLPALLVDVAENQRPVAEDLNRRQVAIHLGSSKDVTATELARQLQLLLLSTELRVSLSRHAREFVDGDGVKRVMTAVRGGNLRLRRAQEQDCRWFWELANDPEVRAASFTGDPISWEQHMRWFNSNVRNPNVILYLAVDQQDDQPELRVGHVRYEIDSREAVVSISLASQFRGKGYGKRVLAMATDALFRTTEVFQVDAHVKADNAASMRLFAGAGYVEHRVEMIRNQQAFHFILKKPATAIDALEVDSLPVLVAGH